MCSTTVPGTAWQVVPNRTAGRLSFYEERIPAFTPGVDPTTLTQAIRIEFYNLTDPNTANE
jgi:hypothetical protein